MCNANDVGNPEERSVVFEALDHERQYQLAKWGTLDADNNLVEVSKAVCDFLVYMQHYLDDAISHASLDAGYETAIAGIAKVTALGVQCMEQHGFPVRRPDRVENARGFGNFFLEEGGVSTRLRS